MFKGLFRESIVVVCEFNELECVGEGGGYWRMALVWGSLDTWNIQS